MFAKFRMFVSKLQETFRTPRKLAANCRRSSEHRENLQQTAGDLPNTEKTCRKLQEIFRTLGKLAANCRRFSEHWENLPQTAGDIPNTVKACFSYWTLIAPNAINKVICFSFWRFYFSLKLKSV